MASLDLLMQAVIEDLWRLFRGEDPKRNVTQKQFNELLPQLGFSAQLRDAGERSQLVAAKDVLRWFGVVAMWANEGYSPTLVGGTIWWNHAARSCSRMGGPDLGRWVAARFPFRSGIGDDVSGRTVAARRATRLDRPLTPPTAAGSREYPPPNIRDSIPQGSRRWFEYHCWESDASQDAELWYRSHSPVTVLGLARNERGELAMESMGFGWSFTERGEAGVPLVYTVRFDDGFEADVTEDELHTSPERFVRPSPPKRPAPPSTGSRGHAGNCTIYNVYEPWFGDDDFPFARDIYDVLDEAEGLFRAAEIRLARDEHIFEVCLDAHGRVLGASTAHEMAGEYPEVRFSIAVHPEARRRGVARELAKRVVDAFGDRELVAWVVNPDVLGLLESLGFSPQSMEWTPDAPFLERRPTVGTRNEYDTILRYLQRAPGPGPGVPSPGWAPPPTPWGNQRVESFREIAQAIARGLQGRHLTPFEISQWFGVPLPIATRATHRAVSAFGPGGQGEQWFVQMLANDMQGHAAAFIAQLPEATAVHLFERTAKWALDTRDEWEVQQLNEFADLLKRIVETGSDWLESPTVPSVYDELARRWSIRYPGDFYAMGAPTGDVVAVYDALQTGGAAVSPLIADAVQAILEQYRPDAHAHERWFHLLRRVWLPVSRATKLTTQGAHA